MSFGSAAVADVRSDPVPFDNVFRAGHIHPIAEVSRDVLPTPAAVPPTVFPEDDMTKPLPFGSERVPVVSVPI